MDSNKTLLLKVINEYKDAFSKEEEDYRKTDDDATLFFANFKDMILDYSEQICEILIEFDQSILNVLRNNHLKMFEEYNNMRKELENRRSEILETIDVAKEIKNLIEGELGEDVTAEIGESLIEREISQLGLQDLKKKFHYYLDRNSLFLVKSKNIERAMNYQKNLLSCSTNINLF